MGDIIGMILFLVQVSDLGMELAPQLPPGAAPGDVPVVPGPPEPAITEKELRLKWVDDISLAESVNLKKQFVQSNAGYEFPVHESLL